MATGSEPLTLTAGELRDGNTSAPGASGAPGAAPGSAPVKRGPGRPPGTGKGKAATAPQVADPPKPIAWGAAAPYLMAVCAPLYAGCKVQCPPLAQWEGLCVSGGLVLQKWIPSVGGFEEEVAFAFCAFAVFGPLLLAYRSLPNGKGTTAEAGHGAPPAPPGTSRDGVAPSV